MLVNAKVDVLNAPQDISDREGYLVVRVVRDPDQHGISLWYYGVYNNEDTARIAAEEIRNGIVIFLGEVEE